MQKLALTAALFFGIVLLTSCERAHPPRPSQISIKIELPVRPEPPHEDLNYSESSAGPKMAMLRSNEDLVAMLKAKFPALNSERASLWFSGKSLITSNGVRYRRLWFSFGDEATKSMHGDCFQNIYLWFASSGDLAEIYVTKMSCPI